jgi:hypothetical protein
MDASREGDFLEQDEFGLEGEMRNAKRRAALFAATSSAASMLTTAYTSSHYRAYPHHSATRLLAPERIGRGSQDSRF